MRCQRVAARPSIYTRAATGNQTLDFGVARIVDADHAREIAMEFVACPLLTRFKLRTQIRTLLPAQRHQRATEGKLLALIARQTRVEIFIACA